MSIWSSVAGAFARGGRLRTGGEIAANWYNRKTGIAGNWASKAAGGTSWGSGYGHLLGGATRGAITGAIIGGGTAVFDKDRGVMGGIMGGAFWGGLAGIGGSALRRSAIKAGRTPQGISGAHRAAAGLTGLYGAGNFLIGKSKRRKHYSRFHHGEQRR